MTTNAVWIRVDAERVVAAWEEEAAEKLKNSQGDVVLDFAAVKRLDPEAVRALNDLASLAEARGVKIVLCALAPQIYKVLKLLKLAPRFAFLA